MEDGSIPIPKLPILGKRNILITSALPNVVDVPHLGNIVGCVLSADVYARYCRLRGYNAIYICGTDDYGTATETKAREENRTPRQICDRYHAIHKEVYDWFDISFDKFGGTSTQEQSQLCLEIFNKLWVKKRLSDYTIPQLYCGSCRRFLAYEHLRGSFSAPGDQCENSRKLLYPTTLKDLRCKVCQTTPQIRVTDDLLIDIPLVQEKLEEYIDKTSVTGSWSQNVIETTNASLMTGLKSICFTSDQKWGVSVPQEKYMNKVFHAWFDAAIGYVSVTSCYTPEWEKWWKNPDNVELCQFLGKDYLLFHTVWFPATQLATGENWTMVKTISATENLNYEGEKFSKIKGVGVFGNDVKDTNIPVEVWRYYLLANRPEVSDTSFKWEDLQAKMNGELLSSLGNFVNQVLTFIAKPENAGYGSVIPDAPGAVSHPLTVSLGEKAGKLVEQYVEAMEKVKLKQGLKTAMLISSEGNKYLQENQVWRIYREDKASCAVVIRTAAGLVHLLAQLLEPFMPSFSREVFKQLNLPPHFSLSDERGELLQARRPWEILPPSHRIGTPQPLFKELKDEEVQQYKTMFAGSQSDGRARDAVAADRRARGAVAADRRARGAVAADRPTLVEQVRRDRLGSRRSWNLGGASSSNDGLATCD